MGQKGTIVYSTLVQQLSANTAGYAENQKKFVYCKVQPIWRKLTYSVCYKYQM
jgi:hypothetical protein